jgi:putative two-component system response regulator
MISDHILIVDDEAPIRQLLARWIKTIGFETTQADSAEAGLEVMTADPAAVVFCDVQMPGQGGLWLTGVLRGRYPETAIVLATGVTTIPATTSLRPGILAYLTKPFDEPTVLQAVQKAMAWHDAVIEHGLQGVHANDEDPGLRAWLDSLE